MGTTSRRRSCAALDDGFGSSVDTVEVFSKVDSTNNYLLSQVAPTGGRFRLVVANQQTEGRGRMGNVWQSPRDAGLYLSCAYTFGQEPKNLSCVTLAIGVAVAAAINTLGADCKLKWPNDLVVDDGKLGGILTEVHPAKSTATTVVVGIGLNLDFGAQLDDIESGIGKVTDLRQALSELPPREEIARLIIDSILAALPRFDADGFQSFYARWPDFDWLVNKSVRVAAAEKDQAGLATGIDTDGALLLTNGDRVDRVLSGTVTVQNGIGAVR